MTIQIGQKSVKVDGVEYEPYAIVVGVSFLNEQNLNKAGDATLLAAAGSQPTAVAAAINALSHPSILRGQFWADGVALVPAAGDTTAPLQSSALVGNSAPSIVAVTFNEAMNTAFTPAASAFTVSGHTVTAVAWAGSNGLNLTLATPFVSGEAARVLGYVQPGSNPARDVAGNLLASFSNAAIVNNVAAVGDTTPPVEASAVVANGSPAVVGVTFNEAMDTGFTPAASAFTIGGHTVSSVAWLSATVLNVTVTAAFVSGEAARTLAYTQPGANQARDVAGNLLASFSGAAITNNVASVAGTVQFSAASYAAAEGTATVTITVTRTGGSSGAASVNYATGNGSATAGSDYTATNGTLNWADGDAASKTFTVAITDDAVVDAAETFTVTLSSATGAALGTPAAATVTITDNDVAANTQPGWFAAPSNAATVNTAALIAGRTLLANGANGGRTGQANLTATGTNYAWFALANSGTPTFRDDASGFTGGFTLQGSSTDGNGTVWYLWRSDNFNAYTGGSVTLL